MHQLVQLKRLDLSVSILQQLKVAVPPAVLRNMFQAAEADIPTGRGDGPDGCLAT